MNVITKGNTAEIVEYEDGLICKLFYSGYPRMYVEHEYENAKAVYQLGIKTPKVYEIVEIGDRSGIVYNRVYGEELSSRLYGANEGNRARWMERFVDFHKELLEYTVDSVIDYKDFLKLFAADSVETISRIDMLGDGNCLLHGDFHPANIMIDTDGYLNLIDMMNICKGPALYDIARTYFLLRNDGRLQSAYLEMMGYGLEAVMPYLEVISLVRKSELRK